MSVLSGGVFDIETLEKTLSRLNAEAENHDLWQDADKAKALLRERTIVQNKLDAIRALTSEFDDMCELHALAKDDAALLAELSVSLEDFAQKVARQRLQSLLNNEADEHDCYVNVNAGSGGTEAQDWAQMLLRMYLRWAEAKRYKVEWLEEQEGQEAGIKSATVRLNGTYAYGWLKHESGIHRLVRLSPFDTHQRRHTSFASIRTYPAIDETIAITIAEKDLRIDTYRASGAGGQHVNKTDSAVRITHLPTSIVVQCQSNRSQHRNRAQAYKMLQARLYALELEKKRATAQNQHSQKDAIGWGHQIRSYVLHPYQMVKDLRFGNEVGNAQAVLDGAIDSFLETALSSTVT